MGRQQGDNFCHPSLSIWMPVEMETVLSPLIAWLGITACILVVYAFGRLLLEVIWRLVMAVALAILASLMLASSLFDGGDDGTAMGVICGFILLPFILKAVWALRGPIVYQLPFGADCDGSPSMARCRPETFDKDRGPEPADDVEDAWTKALSLTGEAPLRDAQAACATLLATAVLSPTIDAGLIDAASFVRRHVPALVQETNDVCELGGEEACTKAREDLKSRLLEIGEMARRVIHDRKSRTRESLSLRHAHIANRLGSFD